MGDYDNFTKHIDNLMLEPLKQKDYREKIFEKVKIPTVYKGNLINSIKKLNLNENPSN